jgi:hypothetical protein
MFPVEKLTVLNTIAHDAMGEIVPPGSTLRVGLMDEQALDRIEESVQRPTTALERIPDLWIGEWSCPRYLRNHLLHPPGETYN